MDVAERLIKKSGGINFTVNEIASAAGVSPATPFNLFGSKEYILYCVCARILDRFTLQIRTSEASDPIDAVMDITEQLAEYFAVNKDVLRHLNTFAAGSSDEYYASAYAERYLSRWERALIRADISTALLPKINPRQFARLLMLNLTGASELWSHNVIDDHTLKAQATFGATILLHGATRPKYRKKLKKLIDLHADRLENATASLNRRSASSR